jgi:hypothetical protein
VIIGDGQGVRFARSFSLGTAQLTLALANRASLPYARAETRRLEAAEFADLPGDMAEVCQQFVRQWLMEFRACLQMFNESSAAPGGAEGVRRLILGGGGPLWAPLREAIRGAAEMPVTLPGTLPGHEDRPGASFLIACGLAADGLGIARAPSSLLTPEIRQSLNRRRNKRYWMLTGGFSLGALAMIGAATQISFLRERRQLGVHNLTLQRSDNIRRESEELLRKQEQVEAMIAPLADFVHNSARIRDLTLYLARVKEADDFITFLGDSESYLQLRLDPGEDGDRREISPSTRLASRELNRKQAEQMRGARMNRLIVEGFTPRRNLASVKALIEELRKHPGVRGADLLSDDFIFEDPERDPQWLSTGFRRFVLDLELVPPRPDAPPPPPAAGRRP